MIVLGDGEMKDTKRKKSNKFLNYSLSKQVNMALFGMVIVPIFVLGIFLIVWQYRTNTTKLYENQLHKIEEGVHELENYYDKIIELPLECMLNDSLLRIGENRAGDKEYYDARKWIDNFSADDPLIDNICITLENGKQIQVGNYVKENMAEVLEKIEKAPAWRTDESADYLLPNTVTAEENLITYYAKISKDYKRANEKTVGIVSVRLKEKEIAKLYDQFFEEENASLSLMMNDGNIISSTEKKSINEKYSDFYNIKSAGKMESQGVRWKNGNVYLYSYSDVLDSYLIEQIPFISFYENIINVIILLLCAVIMCLAFSIAFGRIQKKYIVQPIFEIVNAFGNLEKGEFKTIPYMEREDEIGILQKAFNTMTKRLDNLINQVYRAEFEKKEAELRALTEQINPHFLYNTLDSIHWKAIRNKDSEVAEQILALSDVYRYLLNSGKDFIRVKDEVFFQERYLYLMNMRFGDRLIWESKIDENVMKFQIPKLIIQPLIENAIVHGIEPLPNGGKITMRICCKNETLIIEVTDTGIGFGKELCLHNDQVDTLDGSFALKNINNRLKIYYPHQYDYMIQSSKDGGSRIEIHIWRREQGTDEVNDCR